MGRKIVVDAGSSKIDWCVLGDKPEYFSTTGWNPSQDTLDLSIKNLELQKYLEDAFEIHYYGSGAGTAQAIKRTTKVLSRISPKAQLFVSSDLMGAAKALFGNSSGIVGVLGTGSNVAFYENNELFFKTPSLGYMLSDEGSGMAIGRRIIKDFLYHKMPADISIKFQEQYDLDKETVLDHLYQKANPNIFLAKFTDFLIGINCSYREQLLTNAFKILLENKILAHQNFLSVPIGFAGSIAFHFQNELMEVCKNYDIEEVLIVQKPIRNLATFHNE